MTRLLNIAFQGGTHGNFLRYFIDRFSALTTEIAELPFLSNGNSHNPNIKYSDLIHRYHPKNYNNQYVNVNEPHILITITEDDIPYLHRFTYTRAGDNYAKDLSFRYNGDYVEFTPDLAKIYLEKIKKIYNLKLTNEKIILPKCIVRDFLKLHYLDINKDEVLQDNIQLKKIAPKNTFFFPVDAFWNTKKFLKYIKECNLRLNLNLNLDNTATDVHQQFLKRLHNFQTKDRCKIIFNKILNKEEFDISNIDIVEEGYISAWIEKNYEFVIVPLTNSFFKNTREILTWLEWYPQHYKAMNPNLPTFNGIPNPFYLYNLKKNNNDTN
tara:strand:- start:566 stop:1540 length:975 start_codon:yes stop_codon:yes gene_type:complete